MNRMNWKFLNFQYFIVFGFGINFCELKVNGQTYQIASHSFSHSNVLKFRWHDKWMCLLKKPRLRLKISKRKCLFKANVQWPMIKTVTNQIKMEKLKISQKSACDSTIYQWISIFWRKKIYDNIRIIILTLCNCDPMAVGNRW